MKFTLVFLFAVSLLSMSVNAKADSTKHHPKYKVVTVNFDEAEAKKGTQKRSPDSVSVSLIEKQEMEAQARSETRTNRDDWSGLEY